MLSHYWACSRGFSIGPLRFKEAQRPTLYGWIRSPADGSVEAYACGAADSIRQFERWLAQGPRFAKVEKFEAHEALVEDHDDFEVRSD